MPVIENCMHCGKLCTDGFCPCRWPISVESMFDIIGPAPKEEEEYQYRPGYMLCICCVKQFPESERHGSYCDECHKGMTAGIKWKEPTP